MRDPRVDPQVGDVLRKGNFQRHVTGIGPRSGCVYYSRKTAGAPSATYRNNCTPAGWHRWAKDAEVVSVSGTEAA